MRNGLIVLILFGLTVCECFERIGRLSCGKTPQRLEPDYLSNCRNRVNVTEYNCTKAWNTFAQSFEYKNPEDVTRSDYEPYFDVLPVIVGPNQSLFWSGTFELAGLVSCMCSTGADVVSSSNTLSSAIINDIGNIDWCGNTDGIDYENFCLCSVTTNFWNQFSVEFATVAKETVFYLGYGERDGGAFKNTSAFAQYEVPNLLYPRVKNAVVLNVHRKGRGEACGQGSLAHLRDLLELKNISCSCYNIYGDLNDESQTESLSVCASHIVNATQQGIEPKLDDCFSAEGSGFGTLNVSFTLLMVVLTFYFLVS